MWPTELSQILDLAGLRCRRLCACSSLSFGDHTKRYFIVHTGERTHQLFEGNFRTLSPAQKVRGA